MTGGFAVFFVLSIGLFGEGISIANQAVHFDVTSSTIDGNFFSQQLKTSNSGEVNLLANVFLFGSIAGSLYPLLLFINQRRRNELNG